MEKLDFNLDDEKKETESYDSKEFAIEQGVLRGYLGNSREVIIPKEASSIGYYSFGECSSLEKVVIPESVHLISDVSFTDCESLKEVVFPETLESIGFEAFRNTSLSHVSIPKSVKEIGNRCFARCNIKELNHPLLKIENGLAIKDNRLLYCADKSLKNVIIPDGIEIINSWAFDRCKEIETVVIPDSVKVIGIYAFSDCENLTSLSIPKSVKTIGIRAFFNCNKLNSVKIPEYSNMFGEKVEVIDIDYDYYGYEEGVARYNLDGSVDIYNIDSDDGYDMCKIGDIHIVHFEYESSMYRAGWCLDSPRAKYCNPFI